MIIAAKGDIVSVLKFLLVLERRVARIDGNTEDMRTTMTHARDLKIIILRELPSHPRLKQAERLYLVTIPLTLLLKIRPFKIFDNFFISIH